MTPEGAVLKSIQAYLVATRLGKVRRVNVGQFRMGATPDHPWAKDTRRVVRCGEVGASDLVVDLHGDPRQIHIEVKRPGWKPPRQPRPGASRSTLERYRHHLDQVAFQDRQIARGNFAFFATSVVEVHGRLVALGFQGLPTPPGCPQVRRNPLGGPCPPAGGVR